MKSDATNPILPEPRGLPPGRPSVFPFLGRKAVTEDPVQRDMDELLQAEYPAPAPGPSSPFTPVDVRDLSLAELCDESARAAQFRAQKVRDLQSAIGAYTASKARCDEIAALVAEKERSSGL